MARSGDWRAWRSTDLFGNSHRDRAHASPGVPPAAASGLKGLLRSIAALLDIEIAIPDHTTLSRRGAGLTVLTKVVAT